MMRILIADGNSEVRKALRLVMKQVGIHVTGEASNRGILLSLIAQDCPDAVILDANLPLPRFCTSPSSGGLESLMEQIHAFCPSIYVITLSSQPTTKQNCWQAEAGSFVCKYDPPDGLIEIIEHIRPRYEQNDNR